MAFLEPASVIPYFGLRPNMHVADFGCGTGAYILDIARAVLPNGKVFAIDIQKDLLVNLKNTALEHNVRDLELLWGDVETSGGSKLGDEMIDFALASNILFQTAGGYKVALEIKRVLKPEAKVAVIDWSDSFGGLGPRPVDIVSKEAA
ncbi:MAG: methyltransferase domain-containing protein, partial [Candidatus Vogelbacteria bacterium]|nr:methyltransferase domain-containing protein [Candidatus Vogelbacteria bacterium]